MLILNAYCSYYLIMDLDHSQGSQWVGRALSQAIQIWLRSQADQVKNLKVALAGSNRSILSGYLPKASISATQTIYQGIHLSQVEATGSNIRLNLSQVLRGKPLQLMERFPVDCALVLSPDDLRASL
ncbi:MAG: LmeA family phospholipid-binding protein, partial [Microcoleaceae cyanobacterium]